MFNLPSKTIVNKTIPKNAFHGYASAKLKRRLTDKIEKIIWTNKISPGTINLSGKEIEEIQLFTIKLKEREEVPELLVLFDKAIPYHIIFTVAYNDEYYISTSKKHTHPTNNDQAVIDWTFKTGWFNASSFHLNLNLKNNLDTIYEDLCFQISGSKEKIEQNIDTLIEKEQKIKHLNNQIQKLQSQIKKCNQFNKKVSLNIELSKIEKELKEIQ